MNKNSNDRSCGNDLTCEEFLKSECDDELNKMFLEMCDGNLGDFRSIDCGLLGIKKEVREATRQKLLNSIKKKKNARCPKK